MIQAGLEPSIAQLWCQLCYPAQIRLVLENPDWQKYSIQELADIGLKGARGMKPGAWKQKKDQQVLRVREQANHAAKQALAARLAREKKQAPEKTAATLQSLLNEWL
jgi:hypothetical protein